MRDRCVFVSLCAGVGRYMHALRCVCLCPMSNLAFHILAELSGAKWICILSTLLSQSSVERTGQCFPAPTTGLQAVREGNQIRQ